MVNGHPPPRSTVTQLPLLFLCSILCQSILLPSHLHFNSTMMIETDAGSQSSGNGIPIWVAILVGLITSLIQSLGKSPNPGFGLLSPGLDHVCLSLSLSSAFGMMDRSDNTTEKSRSERCETIGREEESHSKTVRLRLSWFSVWLRSSQGAKQMLILNG